MKLTFAAFLLLALLCRDACAWTKYNESPAFSSYYDESSIVRAGRKASVEVKTERKDGSTSASKMIFDCEEATFKQSNVVLSKPDGSQTAFPSDNSKMNPAISGDVLQSPVLSNLFGVVCKKQGKSK